MSKHRISHDTAPPIVLGSEGHRDQVAAVEAAHDHVQLTMTPEAAVELARIVVQYGSTVRHGHIAPTTHYDPALWHDVGLALNAGVLRATTSGVSRYVAPRPADAAGRRRRGQAPLVLVGGDQ